MYNEDKPKTGLHVQIFAPGLGDLIVQHGVFRHLCENGYNIHLLCKGKGQVELANLSPYIASARYVPNLSEEDKKLFRNLIVQEDVLPDKGYYLGDETFIEQFGQVRMKKVVELMFGGIKSQYDYENTPFPSDSVPNKKAKFILLCPGGRRETKKWSTKNWIKAAGILQSKGYIPVVIGNPKQKGSEQIDTLIKAGIPRLINDNMQSLVDILTQATGVVTIDNGLMHLATCQSTPTVALFGPMKPWLWGGNKPTTKNLIKDCPYNCARKPSDWKCDYADVTCVNQLSVDVVIENLLFLMGREK